MSDRRRQLGIFAVIALVLLRLAIGWHFYREGSSKLSYDKAARRFDITFSAEGFLSQAKGPLAAWFHLFTPTGHNWRELLAVVPPAASQDGGAAAGPPYSAWSQRITEDWAKLWANISTFSGITEKQKRAATEATEARRKELLEYLASQSDAIAEYQHELQRIAQAQATPEADGLPFVERRLEIERAKTARTPLAWVDEVGRIEEQLTNDLRNIFTDEQRADAATAAAIDKALTSKSQQALDIINRLVTWLTVGVGICLLVGFFTRLAAIAGAIFLAAVIATQPPWVAEAAPTYNQLVELAGLLVLAGTGVGRWAGLDFFTYALWRRCCGRNTALP